MLLSGSYSFWTFIIVHFRRYAILSKYVSTFVYVFIVFKVKYIWILCYFQRENGISNKT